MATRSLVPRNSGEGSVGKIAKAWATGVFDNLVINGNDLSFNQGLLDTDNVEFASGNFKNGLTINNVDVATITGKIERILEDNSDFVFFSNVISNNSLAQKTFYDTPTPETYLSGVTLPSADNIRAYLQWDGPPDHYIGSASIEGQDIPLENIQQLGEHTRRFEGYIDNLNVAGSNSISGKANDKSVVISLEEIGGGPTPINISIDEIQNATPLENQELGETHLKSGDSINIYVDFDTDDVSFIKVHEYGLAQEIDYTYYELENISNTNNNITGVTGDLLPIEDISPIYRATIPINVSSREGDLSVAVQAINSFGSTGPLKESSDFAHNSGSRPTDQLYPVIFASDPFEYNGRTDGLRFGESTIFSNNISNWVNGIDSITYKSIDESVSIENSGDFQNFKTVEYKSGIYIDTDNVEIRALRKSNGAIDTENISVKIANGPEIISSEIDDFAIYSQPPHDIGESEVKAGDLVNLKAEVDGKGIDIDDLSIYISNQGLTSGLDYAKYPGTLLGNGNFEFNIEVPVFGQLGSSDRNGDQFIFLKAKNQFGTESDESSTINSLHLNNTGMPIIEISSIHYPSNQKAIKNQESASIEHSITNFDSVLYSSPNNQLTINSPIQYESTKNVNYLTGEYNIKQDSGENNIKIYAIKSSNGTVAESYDVINIANKPLSLSITGLPNLISHGGLLPTEDGSIVFAESGNNQYAFNLNSDQFMLDSPILNLSSNQQDQSLLTHNFADTGKYNNEFTITISDSNTKGSFAWGAYAKNLAGIETTALTSGTHYTLSGFSERVIECSPTSLGAGLANVGTTIIDGNNVVFENLSEGGTGINGGTYYSFESIATGTALDNSFDSNNAFAICDSSGVVNELASYVFNLDKANRSANTATNSPAKFVIKEG